MYGTLVVIVVMTLGYGLAFGVAFGEKVCDESLACRFLIGCVALFVGFVAAIASITFIVGGTPLPVVQGLRSLNLL